MYNKSLIRTLVLQQTGLQIFWATRGTFSTFFCFRFLLFQICILVERYVFRGLCMRPCTKGMCTRCVYSISIEQFIITHSFICFSSIRHCGGAKMKRKEATTMRTSVRYSPCIYMYVYALRCRFGYTKWPEVCKLRKQHNFMCQLIYILFIYIYRSLHEKY